MAISVNGDSVSVGVIGAGAIGGRHVQALGRVGANTSVHLVETNSLNAQRARGWYDEFHAGGDQKELQIHETLETLPGRIDVMVIATQAAGRRDLIEVLLKHTQVRYLIIEKFMFQALEDYSAVQQLLEKNGVKAFVNCTRRLWPGYIDLKNEFAEDGPVHTRIMVPNNEPVGTAGIHFLDLGMFLSGSSYDLSDSKIDPTPTARRHEGIIDFSGLLSGSEPRGGSFEYRMVDHDSMPVNVDVWSRRRHVIIREAEEKAWISADEGNWVWREIDFPVVYQSNLTDLIVRDLVETGSCGLTPYAESVSAHLTILELLLATYRDFKGNRSIEICPIT
jgi:predicted dehydrogenase